MNTVQNNTIVTEDARIVMVQPTRNSDYVQLVVRMEREKKNGSSANIDAQIFSAGNIGTNIEKLIAYRTVHIGFLEAYDIAHDAVTGEILNDKGYLMLEGLEKVNDNESLPDVLPACKILVTETFEARTSKDGSWKQSPKKNPSTGLVLCNNGSPIYLNRELTFDMTKEDTYISHDGTEVSVKTSDSSSPFGALNA